MRVTGTSEPAPFAAEGATRARHDGEVASRKFIYFVRSRSRDSPGHAIISATTSVCACVRLAHNSGRARTKKKRGSAGPLIALNC